MYTKLNLIVLCVVMLNLGECGNCDGLKCLINPSENKNNSTTDILPDINDNLFANLTRFLVEKFSSLINEGPVVKTLSEKNKIYVQTFKVNEITSKNETLKETFKTDDLNNKNNNKSTLHNMYNSTLQKYNISGENWKINNINNAIVTNQAKIKVTTVLPPKYDGLTKNSTLTHEYTTQYEYVTDNVNFSNEQETIRTSPFLNTYNTPGTDESTETTTENLFDESTTAGKQVKINNSDLHIPGETNNVNLNNLIHRITENFNIKDNYIDNTNDYVNNQISVTDLVHDNFTDYLDIDYVDIYKDTTNEDVDYTPAVYVPTTTEATKININKKPTDGVDSVYPWIAAVFVMNPDSKQFEYICDGTLLSERVVLTAARCIVNANVTVDTANILIILGKRSLQSTGPNEKVLRVASIKIHDNFISKDDKVDNDLAMVELAEPATFTVDIQPAPLGVDDKSAPLATATTGWHLTGPLQPLYLKLNSPEICKIDINSQNHLCAILGDNETTCPSFGGLFIERHDDNQWRLKGIATGRPISTGVCFNKNLTFTKIENYLDWIKMNVQKVSHK